MKTAVLFAIFASTLVLATALPDLIVKGGLRGHANKTALPNLKNLTKRPPQGCWLPPRFNKTLPKLNKSSIEEFSFGDIAKIADAVGKGAQIVSGIAGALGGRSLEAFDAEALEEFNFGDIAKIANAVQKGAQVVSGIAGALGGTLEEFDLEALEAFDAEALEEFNFGDIAKIADAVGKGAQIVGGIAKVLSNK